MKKFLFLFLSVILFFGCQFVQSFNETEEESIELSFDKNSLSLLIGEVNVLNLTASKKQNSADIKWVYDSNIVSVTADNYCAIITGLIPGKTEIKAICGSNIATCLLTVEKETYAVKIANPYVYASEDYISVKPQETVRVNASLYGGTAADMNGFIWTVDNPSIASIAAESNYCWITGVKDGQTKITVKHTKASYGYSILVNCSSDGSEICYITTDSNIVNINLSENDTADITLSLVNQIQKENASSDGNFTYSFCDVSGNAVSDVNIINSVITSAGVKITLKAYSSCECYLKVSHPDAIYDLNLFIRVIKDADVSYIEPSQTFVILSEGTSEIIDISLKNYTGTVDSNLITWNFPENINDYVDYVLYNGLEYNTGNKICLTGKKNGSIRITVSYPDLSSRDLVVLINNTNSQSIDSTAYITTSQNYIELYTDSPAEQVYVTLLNVKHDELNDLKWNISNYADNDLGEVINWKTGIGSSSSRSIDLADNSSAYCVIEPLQSGVAYIDISHPKVLYSTRITVKVKERTVKKDKNYINLCSSPIVKIKNGETAEVRISLGQDASADSVQWSAEGRVSVKAVGTECVITAPKAGSGAAQSTVTASYPGAYPVTFSVFTYDSESELNNLDVKAIYSYSTSHTVYAGRTVSLKLETSGFDSLPFITWNVTSGSDCVSVSTVDSNKTAVIEGLKAGKAVIKASCAGCQDVLFNVNVLTENVTKNTKSVLKLTGSPIVKIKNGDSETVRISYGGNGNSDNIIWEAFGNISIKNNGTTCVITAPKTGSGAAQSTVTASYPGAYPVTFSVFTYDSESELNDFNLRTIYSYSTVKTVQTGSEVNLELQTEGFSHGETPSITWKITGGSDCILLNTKNSNKTAVIEGKKAGNAVIKASCSGCEDVFFSVKVVNPADSTETASSGYINLCSSPIVKIKNGETAEVRVSLGQDTSADSVQWSAEGRVSVKAVGTECVITAPKAGSGAAQSTVTASYPGAYPVTFSVFTYDSESELNNLDVKAIYSYSTSHTVGIGSFCRLIVNSVGFAGNPDIKWKIQSGNDNIILSTESSNDTVIVEGIKAGKTVIKAYCEDCSPVYFNITVEKNEEIVSEDFVFTYKSSANVELKNGTDTVLEVGYNGNGDENLIQWTVTGAVSVSGLGTRCSVQAPKVGSGATQSTVTASYPGAYSVTFVINTYDTTEQKNTKYKNIYAASSLLTTIKTGKSTELSVKTEGFLSGETPSIKWIFILGNNLANISTKNSNKTAVISGIKAGKVILKASCEGCSDVIFCIQIEEAGIINVDEPCYLTTSNNVLFFEDEGYSKEVTVELVNIDESAFSELKWKVSGSGFEITSNGNKATVTCTSANSEARLTITHRLSKNELTVYLRSGERYVYINNDFCFISVNQEVFETTVGDKDFYIAATLNHTEASDENNYSVDFSFECEKQGIVELYYPNNSNICYVKPLKNGITKVLVSHPDADFFKEVIIIVNQKENVTDIPYITSQQNVVTVVQGEFAPVSVSLINSKSIDNTKWTWTSKDSKTADVIANNGSTSMIAGYKPGVTMIAVRHSDCDYPLDILVVVLSDTIIQNKPYIKTDKNIITLKKGESTTFKAEMIGGKDSDLNYFRCSSSNNYSILVNSSNESVYVKGLQKGIGYITIYNSRYPDSYSKTVLVIVEEIEEDNIYIQTTSSILKLSPEEKSPTVITASLINGNPLDAENFYWWADDYNLVSLTSVADKCSVVPTGKCGITKVHVSHPKTLKTVDIIVSISNYDKFCFSSNSMNIYAEKLYFVPLEIPAVTDDFYIEYISSNPEICIIEGSKSVAWLCGVSYGTVSLTANLRSTVDNTIISIAEMLVNVTQVNPVKPVISLGDSIIYAEAGENRVISAILSGDDEYAKEVYNLKWSFKNKPDGVKILNEDSEKSFIGPDCYVDFIEGGEYVLQCEHEGLGISAEMYIKVEEIGELDIELSSNLETIYKEDGAFTLTANLINGKEDDYDNIEWSAVKVNGLSIVSFSKTKGQNCIVIPKNFGQTSVIARLPNGKSAACVFIVKPSAEITFETNAVHVIPGYTQTINYTTVPADCTINWFSQMTQGISGFGEFEEYFTFEDDPINKQLRITGIKDYLNGSKVAGTISAYIVGSNSANMTALKVYVEYNQELRLMYHDTSSYLSQLTNNNPDTNNPVSFDIVYFPPDMDIDIIANEKLAACVGTTKMDHTVVNNDIGFKIGDVSRTVISENGTEKAKVSVTFIPTTECSRNIEIKATLPSDSEEKYTVKKSFIYNAFYDKYDIELVPLQEQMSKAFTQFQTDSNGKLTEIELSDGEEAVFYFRIKNENAAGHIVSLGEKQWSTTSSILDCKMGTKPSATDREGLMRYYFNYKDVNEPMDVEKNCRKPNESDGVLYLTNDTTSINGLTVYRLGHGWDYYKDIPKDVSTDGSWEKYLEDHKYDADIFANDKKLSDVDYWVVNRELFYNSKTGFAHNGYNQIEASWNSNDSTYDKWEDYFWNKYENQYVHVKQFFGDSLIFDKIYDNDNGQNPTTYTLNEGFFRTCVPFVVSKEELKNNRALVRPSDKHTSALWKYYRAKGPWDYDDDEWHSDLSCFLIPSYQFIAPTVSKDTTKTPLGSGILTIEYVNGKGEHKRNNTVNVKIVKRKCEAYTNGDWKTETVYDNYLNKYVTHYVLKDELFDSSVLNEIDPFFFTSISSINLKTIDADDSEKLSIPYQISPRTGRITVTVPKTGSIIEFTDYAGVTEDESNIHYTFSSHEATDNVNIGKGSLNFRIKDTGSTKITISATNAGKSLGSVTIPCTVKASTVFAPYNKIDNYVYDFILTDEKDKKVYLNGAYSTFNETEKYIVIGDGEYADFFIKNCDAFTENKTTVSDVKFYKSSEIADAVVDEEHLDRLGCLKKQFGSKISVSDISRSNELIVTDDNIGIYKNDNNQYVLFSVAHNKDYGIYFKTKYTGIHPDGVLQPFKSLDILYFSPLNVFNSKEEKINKLKAKLSEISTNAAENPDNGGSLTTTTLDCYYSDYKEITGEKVYPYSLGGILVIDYTDGEEDEVGLITKSDYIYVFVNVSEAPAVKDCPYYTTTLPSCCTDITCSCDCGGEANNHNHFGL